ncbi:winged helix-turn-helix domain-containing protein [Candidatus Merdisoma sp. HCP28S3_D10]|uniref:winged helix-turn-helix domain-containing protein n=1 Tax=unclassified Candidatus Merdisoma TaxID=3099611 RepID=UPI003F8A41F8
MENRLLSALKQNPYITQTDLAKELSLSRRTVQRIMKELMNDGNKTNSISLPTGNRRCCGA